MTLGFECRRDTPKETSCYQDFLASFRVLGRPLCSVWCPHGLAWDGHRQSRERASHSIIQQHVGSHGDCMSFRSYIAAHREQNKTI